MNTLQGPPPGRPRRRALQSVPTRETGRRELLRRSIIAGIAAVLAAVPLVIGGPGVPTAAGASVVDASVAGASLSEPMAAPADDAGIGEDNSAISAVDPGAARRPAVTNSIVPQGVPADGTAVGITGHITPAASAASPPARPVALGIAATAAVPARFDAGEIIPDAVFYDTGAMTDAQVLAFLQAEGSGCGGPYCLKNIRVDTESQPADRYCAAYTGAGAESAADVIGKVSRACGVNPQVMLTTLQKESGLLDRTDPAVDSYAAAWGWHCPDTGPGGTANCDPAYAGFFRQAYGMAKQWARYRLDPGRYHYHAGQTAEILWNVAETGCGGAPVTIANTATASLYNYTPYQPNAASLASYPGTGDACSSYGNRNFFFLFQRYFRGGPEFGDAAGPSPGGAVDPPTTVVVPRNRFVDPAIAGRVLAVPTAALATGLRAGFDVLGTPYVWGGGGSGAGPDNGCRRGGGQYNSCGHEIGFDCSGLTGYVLGHAGRTVPGDSAGQRSAGVPVSWSDALPGDIVGFPGHVAVYVGTVNGGRYILEASWVGFPVHIVRLTRHDADPVLHRYWSGGPVSVFGALIARSTTAPAADDLSGAFRFDRPGHVAPWTVSPFESGAAGHRSSAAATPRRTPAPMPSTAARSSVPPAEPSTATRTFPPPSTPATSTSTAQQGTSTTPVLPAVSSTPTTRPAAPGATGTSAPSTVTTAPSAPSTTTTASTPRRSTPGSSTPGESPPPSAPSTTTTASTPRPSTPRPSTPRPSTTEESTPSSTAASSVPVPSSPAPSTLTTTAQAPSGSTESPTTEPTPRSSTVTTANEDPSVATTARAVPTEAATANLPTTNVPTTAAPTTAPPTAAAPPPTTSSMPAPTTSSPPPPPTTGSAPSSGQPADGTPCWAIDAEGAAATVAGATPTIVAATAAVVTTVFGRTIRTQAAPSPACTDEG